MLRAAIVGCSGYTALEAALLLSAHPEVKISAATSRQADGSTLADMHPRLTGKTTLPVENLSPAEIAERSDVAFCCLPHAASAPIVSAILDAGCRVIDLSADYRLSTPSLYEHWYGEQHPDPGRLGQTPYGMPELFRDRLADTNLVANPGCYPTSAIVPLTPLVRENLVESQVIVDSKSGVSGAGRSPKLGTLYCETNESISPYSVGTHRHQGEMVDIIERSTSTKLDIIFTPHLVPMHRGILSTIYVRTKGGATANQIRECLATAYQDEPFVRVVPHLPATRYVSGTNYCDISVRENGDWVIILCAIDNLIKGASGAAVQCMNLMFEFDETTALL
ncbi:MAG TPA: N-acetyl-gamma-glutamyl-phosphate reductase [Planctomycetaceae bacterium]|nr:N-acetyl-gamma-glutamyl-phosphate reductase [Planctomycetaceae bacterium]